MCETYKWPELPAKLPDDPLNFLHFRDRQDDPAMCGAGAVVTTSRMQDVTCPKCKAKIDLILGE